ETNDERAGKLLDKNALKRIGAWFVSHLYNISETSDSFRWANTEKASCDRAHPIIFRHISLYMICAWVDESKRGRTTGDSERRKR
ncbi:MAG: hypothetical protein WC864_08370, partial [Ilumatobacteraceae bacterium]